ncbi:autoinhibited Ca2+-ATPase 11 [Actinidia rufa]|uniref:Autoinhibited Ca2+-ATPase 11 n=1 Tax=Actinidia rufa TaxID=165716 RepID=A0A7J0GUG8_9ERIC|nr:autoinhibited Ca2+-ATPase 11 [Actinidia rufa]
MVSSRNNEYLKAFSGVEGIARCLDVSLDMGIILGIAIEGWPEGINDGLGVILCILLAVSIMAISDYKQYLQFRALDEQKKKTFILVTRDGSRQKCSIYDLVVGDVVHLMTGDIVPADGIFIKVQDGSGKMLAASVGMKTYLGSLMGTMSQIGENETPLQVKLNARFLVEKALHNELLKWSTTDALKLLNSVAIAVTVLVVGIP